MSKQTEEQIARFLYKAGIHLNIEKDLEGLPELQLALQTMDPAAAEIITRKYLAREAEYTSHQAIYKEMGISAVTYKKYRMAAFGKLAAELGNLIE